MRFGICLALLLICGNNLVAQPTTPKRESFRASLLSFQKQALDWQRTIREIKVEDLPVSYAEGKVIEQDKQLALQDLQLATKLSVQIHQDESLSDEINLLATTQEMGAELRELGTLLLDTNMTDAKVKVVIDWSTSLTKIANGPLNDFYTGAFMYVSAHADEVESRCPSKM